LPRRLVRLPTDGRPLLDLFSFGRGSPSGHFTPAQIDYIRRTVSRAPEVMVKVTGGGTNSGAVAAHFAYISRKGELAIETDDGYRVAGRDAQKALLNDWHLELSAGQYRGPRDGRVTARRVKLVHNIVFSMPSPTPPEKVLAAARKFAREKFALQHRFAMALHTDQQHPHVHMVVKAESEQGRRVHIDKTMLREWREDFARLMREQGIAANATPRALRGTNKGKTKDAIYRAQRRGTSHAVRDRVKDVVNELMSTGTVHDPARRHMLETRRAVVAAWTKTADQLDTQGESILAGKVRSFSQHLPPVLTDRERLAVQFLQHRASRRAIAPTVGEDIRQRDDPLTR
jgi:Relaxase/Mobilisation nuclease domain